LPATTAAKKKAVRVVFTAAWVVLGLFILNLSVSGCLKLLAGNFLADTRPANLEAEFHRQTGLFEANRFSPPDSGH
jgi:hypothetical protein